MRKQIRPIITGVVCLGAVLAGCGGDDDADSGSTTAKPTTTVAVEPLRILVTAFPEQSDRWRRLGGRGG